jgi:hypothetical protein
MRERPESENKGQDAANDQEESLYAALSQAEQKQNRRYTKIHEYFSEVGNWVGFLTLLAVAAYTAITSGLFFVGYRAIVYFERAIIKIAEEPVPPESNGQITLFNGPWVTHKVVRIDFALTNAGNTATQNMRVILDCRRLGFGELQRTDPFVHFKWDDKKAHPEIIGPKQTIQIGPCEAEATAASLLDAQTGIVPIILMGEIRYEDRVGVGKWAKHVTQFSQRLIISHFNPDAGEIVATTQSIGNHNCADDCAP